MRVFALSVSFFCLISFMAAAEENSVIPEEPTSPANEISAVEDLASRMVVIKPQQYINVIKPTRDEAHRLAKSLDDKEAKALIEIQNRINKTQAHIAGEPEPENITIDPNDKQALEEMLTPDIYTYDDIPIKFR